MSSKTEIEWADSTFNPWKICTPVGEGCKNCYAAALSTRFGWGEYKQGVPRQRTSESNWKLPVRWNRSARSGMFVECSECGKREYRKWDNTLPPGGLSCCSNPNCMALPESESFAVRPRVFCASMADWLDNEVPIDWLVDLLGLIMQTPNLDWLLLTKRIGNWRRRMEVAAEQVRLSIGRDTCLIPLQTWIVNWLDGKPPENVWIGATVVDQEEADRDIPKLLQVPARIRFLSIEPILGAIDIAQWLNKPWCPTHDFDGGFCMQDCGDWRHINWIIAGGESGPHARPAHPDWFRSLRDQCGAACVPFFFKQWGEWGFDPYPKNSMHPYDSVTVGDEMLFKCGKKKAGNMLDGREHKEFPEVTW